MNTTGPLIHNAGPKIDWRDKSRIMLEDQVSQLKIQVAKLERGLASLERIVSVGRQSESPATAELRLLIEEVRIRLGMEPRELGWRPK